MHHINKRKAGLALGSITGGFHLVWSILVALGWAKPLIDFILGLHMIKVPFTIQPFNAGLALALIVVTAIIGYTVGYLFSFAWNKIHF